MNLDNNQQSSNKWLFFLLFVVVILSVWTAFKVGAYDDLNTVELSERPATTSEAKLPAFKKIEKNSKNELDDSTWAIPWNKLKRESLEVKNTHLFAVHSWEVLPPVKKIKPVPPPPPEAPVAPFIYIGKLEDTPKNTQIFLMTNERLYSTRLGENIDQQWRLDIEDANTLRLTYLPLNLQQVLSKNARPFIAPVEVLPVVENNY